MKYQRATIIFLFSLSSTLSLAQQDQDKIESYRIAFITEQLQLTPEESKDFWPVYIEYKNSVQALRRSQPGIRQMLLMTDDELSNYLETTLENDQKELDLKREFIGKLKGIISVRKIARLSFAEREFNTRMLQRIRQKN